MVSRGQTAWAGDRRMINRRIAQARACGARTGDGQRHEQQCRHRERRDRCLYAAAQLMRLISNQLGGRRCGRQHTSTLVPNVVLASRCPPQDSFCLVMRNVYCPPKRPVLPPQTYLYCPPKRSFVPCQACQKVCVCSLLPLPQLSRHSFRHLPRFRMEDCRRHIVTFA